MLKIRNRKDPLFEYYEQKEKLLLEMARVDDPSDPVSIGYEIWIYGNDRNGYSPHFHIINKQIGFNLEIRISDLKIIKSSPRKKVPKLELLTWKGIEFLKKDLYKWVKSIDANTGYSNYDLLIINWNSNNREGIQLKKTECLDLAKINLHDF